MFSFSTPFKPRTAPNPAFLSFDVEALPLRCADRPVETLIWGQTPQGEYGIRRICQILREHKLKGNFLVDMAAAPLYGDDVLREVVDYLRGEGHEVHAHLHPELLADQWRFKRTGMRERRLNEMDQQMNDALLKFSFVTFARVAGRIPFLFRSGSYLFNRHTVTAATRAGFRALSNYNHERHISILPYDATAARMEPFRWVEEGLMEIPVDISSPEKSRWKGFLSNIGTAQSKPAEKTCNLVFHSWSLLRRDENGHHREFGPELDEAFHRICGHVASTMKVLGYEEYAGQKADWPEVATEQCQSLPPIAFQKAAQCPHCGAVAALESVPDLSCPGCPGGRMVKKTY